MNNALDQSLVQLPAVMGFCFQSWFLVFDSREEICHVFLKLKAIPLPQICVALCRVQQVSFMSVHLFCCLLVGCNSHSDQLLNQ